MKDGASQEVPSAPELPDYPERGKQKEALQAAGEYLYRRWGWQTDLARRIQVDPRTVRRWISDQEAIDRTAWELIKLMVEWKKRYGATP